MIDKSELCRKIMEIYPEIGQCDIDLDVHFDEEKKAWVARLAKGGKELATHLDDDEIQACLDGRQCVALGVHVAELSRNVREV